MFSRVSFFYSEFEVRDDACWRSWFWLLFSRRADEVCEDDDGEDNSDDEEDEHDGERE